jgi:uncharacterized membrane protein (Fun14 family)
MKLDVLLIVSSTIVGFWLLKALRIVKDLIFLSISFYLLSLFILVKAGFITIHPEKFQELYQAIEGWFVAFADWIIFNLSDKAA